MMHVGENMSSESNRTPPSSQGAARHVQRVLALVVLAVASCGFLSGCATSEESPAVIPRVGHAPLGAPSCFLLDGDIKIARGGFRGALESYLNAIMTSRSGCIGTYFHSRWRHDKVAAALEAVAWEDTVEDDTLKALALAALDKWKDARALLRSRLMKENAPTARFRLFVLLDECTVPRSQIETPIGELDEHATAVDECQMLMRRWTRSRDLNEMLALSKKLVEEFDWCETSYSLRESTLRRAGRKTERAGIAEERIRKCGLTSLAFYELIIHLKDPATREDEAWAVARELAVRFPYYDMTSIEIPLLGGQGPPQPKPPRDRTPGWRDDLR